MHSNLTGSAPSREALLVKKVASSAPLLVPPRARNHTASVRRNLERQMRNTSDEKSLHVFIRLMRAGHFLNEDTNKEETRPMAPPTSPVPSLETNLNDDDGTVSDVSTNSSSSQPTTSRNHSNSRSTNNTPRPNVMVNSWMSPEVKSNAWLVMRGQNIQLKHQDHVKSAITSTRHIQSAPQTNRSKASGKMTPSAKFKSHYHSNLPVSHPKHRSCKNSQVSLQIKNHRMGKGDVPFSNGSLHCRDRFPNRYDKLLQRSSHLRPMTSPPDNTKTLVIKLPHASKNSR